MKSASASWSSALEPKSAASFVAATRSRESTRDGQPAQTQTRGERLAGGAGVGHPVGAEPLHRADGLPVVAVFRVVVVLDDQGVLSIGPVDERRAPLGREHGAGRVLVRRCQHHCVDPSPFEPLDLDAGIVHGHGHDLEPGGPDGLPIGGVPGILDADAPGPRLAESSRHELDTLGEAVADDDVAAARAGAAHPVEIRREHVAQLGHAAPVEIVEALCR